MTNLFLHPFIQSFAHFSNPNTEVSELAFAVSHTGTVHPHVLGGLGVTPNHKGLKTKLASWDLILFVQTFIVLQFCFVFKMWFKGED